MISGDRRYCDVCDIPILTGEPHYIGIAPQGTDDRLRTADDLRTVPTFTPLSDGRIRFEICLECVSTSPQLRELMIETTAVSVHT
jgi:hypothetical protein